jgi:hypothetical protein
LRRKYIPETPAAIARETMNEERIFDGLTGNREGLGRWTREDDKEDILGVEAKFEGRKDRKRGKKKKQKKKWRRTRAS